MLIAFTHAFKAFLPEIEAYRHFFKEHGIQTVETSPDTIALLKPDVEWRFMGVQLRKNASRVLIHEYASASLPPWRQLKDTIKRKLNATPDFRLFLNDYVKGRFHFTDGIPFGFRDMGIYTEVASQEAPKKLYDFIYIGSVSRDIRADRLLDCFTQEHLRDKSLLVLSRNYEDLQSRYQSFSNIIFKGPVQREEVSQFIRQSSFAINYKPDIAPHNLQTSTRFLEYAACRVPVISTGFAWMHQFQQSYGGNYFYLQPDLSNFTWEKVHHFQYAFPDLSTWTWEQQIRRSGVLQFLKGKFPELPF